MQYSENTDIIKVNAIIVLNDDDTMVGIFRADDDWKCRYDFDALLAETAVETNDGVTDYQSALDDALNNGLFDPYDLDYHKKADIIVKGRGKVGEKYVIELS